MTAYLATGLAVICCAFVFATQSDPSPYLGQPVPGLTPKLFAPGIVSTDAVELNSVFTPDLKEFFFSRQVEGRPSLFHSTLVDGKWSAPEELILFPGGKRALAVDMSISPDGRELFFMGSTAHEHSTAPPNPDIWRSRRIDGKWSTAELVRAPISTDASEVYSSVANDGSLYFTSNRPGGIGSGSSLYRAQRLPSGDFAAPVLVPPPINSESGVGDVFVSPDERYIVLSLGRPPSIGRGDLFVSFRSKDGNWGDPIHLGAAINSTETDYCPMVTPDGRYLFFSRRPAGIPATAGDVFWVDAKILEQAAGGRRP